MAANLQAGGHDLVVHDAAAGGGRRPHRRRRHLGRHPGRAWRRPARWSSRPCPARPRSRRWPPAWTGCSTRCAAGTAWFDLSTNSPTVVRRLHELASAPRASSCSTPRCQRRARGRGDRASWPSGWAATRRPSTATARCCEAFSDQPYYVGPIGAGSVAKLVHNCAGYVLQTALAEVFTLGVKAGRRPGRAVAGGAPRRHRPAPHVRRPGATSSCVNRFDPPSFALRLAHKDVSLATALGRELGRADAPGQPRPSRR